MMVKFALANVKKRWQDYLVLLTGLVIAVAIFYMFQTLSLNRDFLEQNISSVSVITIVFQLGAFLLGIITIVYLFYANSFLLSMRKKEYGMSIMLGAKKKKISQLIALETFFIGGLSLLVGLFLGTLLAAFMGSWLSQRIQLPADTYTPFVITALWVTLLFFSVVFGLMMIVNMATFKRTRTLDLLYSETQSERAQSGPIRLVVKIITALSLIGIGYVAMVNLAKLQVVGIFLAIVTITPGTFLFFSSLVPVGVARLKNNQRFSSQNLRIFTLSQLSFKASSLARVLGLVTMMLALSLGAITVGQSFNNLSEDILKTMANDVVIYDESPQIAAEVAKLEVKEVLNYQTKVGEEEQYFLAAEFDKQPLLIRESQAWDAELVPFKTMEVAKRYTYSEDYQIASGFNQLTESYQSEFSQGRAFVSLSTADFMALPLETKDVKIIRLENFGEDQGILTTIDQLESARHPGAEFSSAKIDAYQQVMTLTSGFMFMGFFVGIAFLGMLASCLMFKLLSSAYQDRSRYEMLHKIGVSQKKLKRSLRQEILAVFGLPAILGLVHVLVGLKMFAIFLPDPYAYLALPFMIFGAIYFGYYLITTRLYQKIVLPAK